MEYKEYKVQWAENKTTETGKPYKKLSIEDNGMKTDVNIFSDFPDFANIIPGSTIRGALEQKGQYWNIISETRGKSAYSKPQVHPAMEYQKEITKSVEKAQNNKEESIKLAGAQRDAVLIVTHFYYNTDVVNGLDEFVKEKIIKYRNWFLLSDDFNNIPPFE